MLITQFEETVWIEGKKHQQQTKNFLILSKHCFGGNGIKTDMSVKGRDRVGLKFMVSKSASDTALLNQ